MKNVSNKPQSHHNWSCKGIHCCFTISQLKVENLHYNSPWKSNEINWKLPVESLCDVSMVLGQCQCQAIWFVALFPSPFCASYSTPPTAKQPKRSSNYFQSSLLILNVSQIFDRRATSSSLPSSSQRPYHRMTKLNFKLSTE